MTSTKKIKSTFVKSPKSFYGSHQDPITLACAAENVDKSIEEIWVKDGKYMPKSVLQSLPVIQRTGVYWCEAWALDNYRRIRSSPARISFSDQFVFGLDVVAPKLTYQANVYDEFNRFINGGPSIPNVDIISIINGVLPKAIGGVKMSYEISLRGFSRGSVVSHLAVYASPDGAEKAIDEDAQASIEQRIMRAMRNKVLDSLQSNSPRYSPVLDTQLGVTASGVSFHSNNYCDQERIQVSTGKWLTFPRTRSSRIAYSEQRCLSDGTAFGTRPCQAPLPSSISVGARWGRISLYTNCSPNYTRSSFTDTLETLAEESPTNVGAGPLSYARSGANYTRKPDQLAYSDLVYASQILNNLALQEEAQEDSDVLSEMTDIVENMMEANRKEMKRAQTIGKSGSRVKSSMDQYVRSVNIGSSKKREVVQPQVALTVLDLTEADGDFAGFQVNGNLDSNVTFNEGDIMAVANAADFNYQDSISGCLFPTSLVSKLLQVSNNTGEASARISVIAYRDSRLFSDESEETTFEGDSNILSVQMGRDLSYISDFDQLGITDKVQVIFEPITGSQTPTCGFWNFTLRNEVSNEVGAWDTRDCSYSTSIDGRAICECSHLTNFAILLNVAGDDVDETHELILGIITKVGLSVSIAALGLAIVTFAIFPTLRQSVSQRILLNLCIALIAANLLFLVGIERTEITTVCMVISALLQYFIIAAFSWMLVEAVHHYLRFVKVLGTYIPRFMLKASIPCWLFPSLFVAATAAMDKNLFVREHYCWLQPKAIYYFFIPPVGGIILCNMVLFILIIRGITNRPKMKTNQSEKKLALIQVRASIATLTVLGLTWLFGFLAVDLATLPMQYLFCIFNSFQGLFIFIMHLAREKVVQRQWMKCCCPKRYLDKKFGRATQSSSGPSRQNRTFDTEVNNSSTFQAIDANNKPINEGNSVLINGREEITTRQRATSPPQSTVSAGKSSSSQRSRSSSKRS